MMKAISSSEAPVVIGTYSSAIKVGATIYLSGQIPLDPLTQVLCSEDIIVQIKQVIKNMEALCVAAGGSLADVVKITVYLMDLAHSTLFNLIQREPWFRLLGYREGPKSKWMRLWYYDESFVLPAVKSLYRQHQDFG